MLVRLSKLSDFKVKKIIWSFCVDIDATKTSLIVGVNRNTVNHFYQLFRTLIWYHQFQEFRRTIKGEAECDEAYFGGKRRRGVPGKRGRGTNKQPVFGIFERNGRVYTEIVAKCDKPTLQKIIRGISTKSIVHTDKWRGYDGLVDVGFDKPFRINHLKESEWRYGKTKHQMFNELVVLLKESSKKIVS